MSDRKEPGGQGEETGRDLKGNWKGAEGKTDQAWGKPAEDEPKDGRDARLERTRERYGQTYDAEGHGHPEDEPTSRP
ncbi:hypothetical protein ACE7GA_14840 [Roseomonas sp. CCTCC AB2023176]|uniref:hypothetical protein n=1 Tax=Roseomonas sp. CCTCC AB2023176 TaxID=3342640 RepID=UPI0035D88301